MQVSLQCLVHDGLSACPCSGTRVLFPSPAHPTAAAGVPYSVVVHAVTGGGRGPESEREVFFSRELGELASFTTCVCVLNLCVLKHYAVALPCQSWWLCCVHASAPTKAVSNTTATRMDGTSMLVSWSELTLREARGVPVYTILYESTTGAVVRTTRQAGSAAGNVTGVMSPPVTVMGLDPASEYTVQVRVDTDETADDESGPVSQSGQSPFVHCM